MGAALSLSYAALDLLAQAAGRRVGDGGGGGTEIALRELERRRMDAALPPGELLLEGLPAPAPVQVRPCSKRPNGTLGRI